MTSRWKLLTLSGGLVLAALAGTAAFYSLAGDGGNSATCPDSAGKLAAMAPLARDDVAAVEVGKTARALPDLAFQGPDGQPLTLASFRGRTLLVNLWATWCPPCLKEMPSLDRLQGEMGGKDFEVVAINIDTRNLDKPRAWLAERTIAKLAYYADPQAKVFQDMRAARKVDGMPISLIVDPSGCELALLQGPAEWSSPAAKALIRAALGR